MTGWECPKCGGVYAPYVERCEPCVPRDTSVASNHLQVAGLEHCPSCGRPRIFPGLTGCPMGEHSGTYTLGSGTGYWA